MEQEMLAEARAEADAELAGGNGSGGRRHGQPDNWHPGIVGLLASRLKDHARRPAFAIAFNANGIGTGSGRSVAGFDLGRLVREAAEHGLIVKGGGHAHGGRHHGRARRSSARCAPSSRSAPPPRCFGCRTRRAWRSTPRSPPKAPRSTCSTRWSGPARSGWDMPRRSSRWPRHRLADARPVGAGHIRAELESPTAAAAPGDRLPRRGYRAWRVPVAAAGQTVHVAGSLAGN